VSAGLVVLVVVLVGASAFGVYRRLTDGRIRGVDQRGRARRAGDPAAPPSPDLVTAADIG